MIILVVIVILILFVLAWIIFVPVILKVDTTTGQYEIGQPITFRFSLQPFEDTFFKLRLFGYEIVLKQKSMKQDKINRKPARTKPGKSFAAWKSLIREIPSVFRLRYLYGTIDFDDVVLNAKMIPVMMLLNRDPVNLTTNFRGQSFIKLRVDIKLYMVLWIVLKFSTKK